MSKSEFRSKAYAVFRQIESTGIPVVITHRGVDVLEVVPYDVESHTKKDAGTGSLDASR